MKLCKSIIALALALAMVPGGAYAKPHRQITDAQLRDCLDIEYDPDGTQWCAKSSRGLSKAQIAAWEDAENKKAAAAVKARLAALDAPTIENCTREFAWAKSHDGKWGVGGKASSSWRKASRTGRAPYFRTRHGATLPTGSNGCNVGLVPAPIRGMSIITTTEEYIRGYLL
jgi:hypothetical protein